MGLLLAIVFGILIPQAAVFSYLIQYLVFAMLFLSFVGLVFERSALRPNLLRVLVANVCVALAAVSNFTQWLAVHIAQEYSPEIRVNALAPGFFLTEQNRFLLIDAETGN